MKNSNVDQKRVSDKTKLLLKFNYISSVLSLAMGLICFYILNIKGSIPVVFVLYGILNMVNSVFFRIHGNLTATALATSTISLISTLIIVIFSGGINSPFIFVLAIIVLAGYISTRFFGKLYLFSILLIVISIYALRFIDQSYITNTIPPDSQDMFSLISVLFAVYLTGGVFGKDLLKVHHQLYKSKAEIEKRIDEKEMLLREVHHRVKNNLQTVSSLLNLQAKTSQSAQIGKLMKSCQNRVTSMAMIHEMLYMNDDLSVVEFKSYVHELTKYLKKSTRKANGDIAININMPDISLNIDTAIPLGLLINEAVTNSLKYGFAEREYGQININLSKEVKEEENHSYSLKIGDDGVGYPPGLDHRNSSSLGLKLIYNLPKQLRGSIERDYSKKGTNYHISFKKFDKHLSTST